MDLDTRILIAQTYAETTRKKDASVKKMSYTRQIDLEIPEND